MSTLSAHTCIIHFNSRTVPLVNCVPTLTRNWEGAPYKDLEWQRFPIPEVLLYAPFGLIHCHRQARTIMRCRTTRCLIVLDLTSGGYLSATFAGYGWDSESGYHRGWIFHHHRDHHLADTVIPDDCRSRCHWSSHHKVVLTHELRVVSSALACSGETSGVTRGNNQPNGACRCCQQLVIGQQYMINLPFRGSWHRKGQR